VTELFVQLDKSFADDADLQQFAGVAGLVVDGRALQPHRCRALPATVAALMGADSDLGDWCDEPDPVRIVDGGLEACARLRDAQPDLAWLPRLVAYKPDVVYRMSDYPGEGFRFYAPDTAAIRGYRVNDRDLDLTQALEQARALGFDQAWLHGQDAARRGDGLDLEMLERARRTFGDGLWLSGGASDPQHLANLVRCGGSQRVIVAATLLAAADAEKLTAALVPPPPAEEPIHFDLPRGEDSCLA
jgi:hypothetical protein